MRLATNQEAPDIRQHYDEVTAYASRVGFIDWPNPFPLETINSLIAKNELFIWGDEAIKAVARVSLVASDVIWGQSEDNQRYVYIGKLAGASSIRGTGYIKSTVLTEVADFAANTDKIGIRLDCLATNKGLYNFYARLGCQDRGISTFWSQSQDSEIVVQRFEIKI
ncbi:MAG: hypothetical protein U0451_01910 [Candidatus Saccharimonadales bacterium]